MQQRFGLSKCWNRHWHLREFKENRVHAFNQDSTIASLNSKPMKLDDQFKYLGSNISSTKNEVNLRTRKAWSAIDRLLRIWKPDFPDEFSPTVVVSVLLYGCTILYALTKRFEKRLDGNYILLLAVWNKSWKQRPTKKQLYDHLLTISQCH